MLIDTYFKVHKHGFIALKDKMGDDHSIEQAARVSYGKGTRATSDTRTLIRYLRRNKHTTPFESVVFSFHIALPIFIERQWIRHRGDGAPITTNERSLRYSEAEDVFYVPKYLNKQSQSNKQGSASEVVENPNAVIAIREVNDHAYDNYKFLLEQGASREQSRVLLPLSTYTFKYWTCNLHNLFHFLKLRLHLHAQQEIRDYAHIIACILKQEVPIAFEAFLDYDLNRVEMRPEEIEAAGICFDGPEEYTVSRLKDHGYTDREIAEWKAKIDYEPIPMEHFDHSKLITITPNGA